MDTWTVLRGFLKINYLTDVSFSVFLKDICIIEKHYLKANNVWNLFKMNKMGDYHDLYLKADVLLLANLFENSLNTD